MVYLLEAATSSYHLSLIHIFSALYSGIHWLFCVFRKEPTITSTLCARYPPLRAKRLDVYKRQDYYRLLKAAMPKLRISCLFDPNISNEDGDYKEYRGCLLYTSFTAEGERLAVELMKKYGLGDRKEDEV